MYCGPAKHSRVEEEIVVQFGGVWQCVAEFGGASGERRAATDASPQAASPQLNSRSGGRLEEGLGRLGRGIEVVKSRSACTHTESNDGNESIDLNGFDLLKTSINVGQRFMD